MKKGKGIFGKIKFDILLISVLIAVGAAVLLFAFLNGQGGAYVQIKVDGRVTAVCPLAENRTVTINGINGTNLLVIENGEAYIGEADCPDKLCVNQGKISMTGQSVICLPHRIVVEITGEEQKDNSEIDVIVK